MTFKMVDEAGEAPPRPETRGPVTAKSLTRRAEQAAKTINELRQEFPKTAEIIVRFVPIVVEESDHDPDAVTARELTLTAGTQGAKRLAEATVSGKDKSINPARVRRGLNRLAATAQFGPSQLMNEVGAFQKSIIEKQKETHGTGTTQDSRLEEQRELCQQAQAELEPHLSRK